MTQKKKLGFGTMRLPLLNPDDKTSVDIPQFEKMIDTFIAKGFTYFDTAYPYHEETSELAVREALVKRHPRDSFTLADKMPMHMVRTADDLPRFFNEQLEKCGVEYFDYYLLHNLGRDRYEIAQKTDAFGFLLSLKEKGLAHQIGFSFHDTADVLDRILTDHPEVDFVQLQLNYLDWDNNIIQSSKNYETCCRHGKKVVVMEPVKGGTLAKLPAEALDIFDELEPVAEKQQSPASYAIRFAASLENVFMVLSGMSNMEQLDDNTSYMQDFTPLSEIERKAVDSVKNILNRTIKVPCTACSYCLEVCPIQVNIPLYFGLLNGYHTAGVVSGMYYARASMNHAKAKDCLQCGRCEKICPQHINIRENLKQFHEIYKKLEDA